MFWLDIVWHRCGIIHQSREGRKRKSDESRPTILLMLFCVVRRCCYRILLFFELCKMADDHGEDEKINNHQKIPSMLLQLLLEIQINCRIKKYLCFSRCKSDRHSSILQQTHWFVSCEADYLRKIRHCL